MNVQRRPSSQLLRGTRAPTSLTTSLTLAAAFGAALRGEPCLVVSDHCTTLLPTWRWGKEPDSADEELLARCHGATVDIGCGPGRMTEALLGRGIAALGIDIAPEAVELARARGGVALQRDVFSALPGEGRWDTALLADGNIGIGGDPLRLLRRTTDLLGRHGRIVVELSPPGGWVRTHQIRLEVRDRRTPRFNWAVVPADCIAWLSPAAALQVVDVIEHQGRWVAELVKTASR